MKASSLEEISCRLVDMAKSAGAKDTDVIGVADTNESIRVRHGKVESVEREDARGIGLRAFVSRKGGLAFATTSTSDLSDAGLGQLISRVIAMARISAPDPDAVPPAGSLHPDVLPPAEKRDALWNRHDAQKAALACEQAALDYSQNITNSEGAEAGFGQRQITYACADGFSASYISYSAGIGVSVIAGKGANMQRDYEFERCQSPSALSNAGILGRKAAERACRRLGAESIPARQTAVVFEPRVAVSLASHLAAAINGRSVLQQRSFLADSLDEQIFPDWVRISDDPNHEKGLANRPFDDEGTRTRPRDIVDSGRLSCFLTDRYAANRLGSQSTGHASRGLTGDMAIAPSNLIWHAGDVSMASLLQEVGDGVFITELMGFGINAVTGDYSRGAAGFLIEGGKLTRPVQEITIAGNLKQMFGNVELAADDLAWFGSRASPTLAISGMTIAGQ